jgi:predicted TIM-barrel fold metal-dependent hydrolase
MIDPGHALTGIDHLGLSADAREDYLHGNAERVFNLRG